MSSFVNQYRNSGVVSYSWYSVPYDCPRVCRFNRAPRVRLCVCAYCRFLCVYELGVRGVSSVSVHLCVFAVCRAAERAPVDIFRQMCAVSLNGHAPLLRVSSFLMKWTLSHQNALPQLQVGVRVCVSGCVVDCASLSRCLYVLPLSSLALCVCLSLSFSVLPYCLAVGCVLYSYVYMCIIFDEMDALAPKRSASAAGSYLSLFSLFVSFGFSFLASLFLFFRSFCWMTILSPV